MGERRRKKRRGHGQRSLPCVQDLTDRTDLAVGEAKGGAEVLGEVGRLGDSGEDTLVERLLVGGLVGREDLLLAVLEEGRLGAGAVVGGRLGKVGIVELGVNLRVSRKRSAGAPSAESR